MWIKIRIKDMVVCGSFNASEIADEAMIQQLGVEFFELVEMAAETKKLLLSFEGVEFMSSAFIGKLVLLNKQAKTRGIQMKFCDVSPNVLEVFKITRLNHLFRTRPERDIDDDDDDDDGSGNAGVFAKLPKHPGSGGTHAKPPREDA